MKNVILAILLVITTNVIASTWKQKVDSLEALGETEQALQVCLAQQSQNTSQDLLLSLTIANCYLNLENYSLSKKLFISLLNENYNPGTRQFIKIRIANLYMIESKLDSAKILLDEVKKFNPDNHNTIYLLYTAYAQYYDLKKDYNKVLEALLEAKKTNLYSNTVAMNIFETKTKLKIVAQSDIRKIDSILSAPISSLDNKLTCASLLTTYYISMSNMQELNKYYNLTISFKDSLTSYTQIEQQSKLAASFQMKEKEFKINSLNEQKANQQKIIIIVGIVLVLVVLFSIVIFKQYQRSKAQKQIIEHKNKDITDSINYAAGIQQTILPQVMKNAFVLFQPKDIVSGDFYWYKEKENRMYYVVADCTGHGVPGALLSMLCTEFLNQAVERFIQPKDILSYVNNELKKRMEQLGRQDGMEIGLVCVDNNVNEIIFCGAKRNLYIVNNNNLVEYSANKKAIGGDNNYDTQYEQHIIRKNIGDKLYMTTDGYVDQFGGENEKKYSTKRFKETLISLESNFSTQQNELANIITDWKGNVEQVDDILVMGISIA